MSETQDMKALEVSVTCMATYNSTIMVPKNLSLEEAIQYAKDHVNVIPVTELNYVSDSDQIDEENCHFEEDYEQDLDEYDDDENDQMIPSDFDM